MNVYVSGFSVDSDDIHRFPVVVWPTYHAYLAITATTAKGSSRRESTTRNMGQLSARGNQTRQRNL